MEKLLWKRSAKLADCSLKDIIEDSTGKSLPSDYVNCAVKNNKGRPSLRMFITQKGVKRIMNNLLSLNKEDGENVFEVYQHLTTETGREDIIPFARDSFGNYICFDYSGILPTIVFWEHETNSFDTVATTFTDFINMLSET